MTWNEPAENEASLVDVINVLLQQRRLLIVMPILSFALVIGITLLSPRTYTSRAAFMLQASESTQNRLLGVAAQLGFVMPSGESGTTPAFYEELLTSRATVSDVVRTKYAFTVDGVEMTGDLTELYEIDGESDTLRRESAIEELLEDISVSTRPETGIVRLSVKAPWAPLAPQIADRMLERMSEFDLLTRQSQAGAERAFVEERLAAVRKELTAVEDALVRFLRDNRQFTAPELQFERDRLEREVAMRQEVYTGLAEAYERARIDEVRDTPVITIIEHPEVPPLPDRRRLILKGIAAIFLGLVLGVVIAFLRSAMASESERDPESYQRSRELWAALGAELRNPLRLFIRR